MAPVAREDVPAVLSVVVAQIFHAYAQRDEAKDGFLPQANREGQDEAHKSVGGNKERGKQESHTDPVVLEVRS